MELRGTIYARIRMRKKCDGVYWQKDITMQALDTHSRYAPIKLDIGGSPYLLVASGATNFVFEVIGLDDRQAEMINAISTDTKIIDRIEKIFEYGTLEYRKVKNRNFAENVR